MHPDIKLCTTCKTAPAMWLITNGLKNLCHPCKVAWDYRELPDHG